MGQQNPAQLPIGSWAWPILRLAGSEVGLQHIYTCVYVHVGACVAHADSSVILYTAHVSKVFEWQCSLVSDRFS